MFDGGAVERIVGALEAEAQVAGWHLDGSAREMLRGVIRALGDEAQLLVRVTIDECAGDRLRLVANALDSGEVAMAWPRLGCVVAEEAVV